MTGIIKQDKDSITIELYSRTYNSQEKFDDLLHEVKEKYNLKKVNAIMGRTKDKPRKLTLTFHI